MMNQLWEKLYAKQPIVMQFLKQAILKDRVAHAYLFEGMKGTGKGEIGIFLAKALFCENIKDQFIPCDECINCVRITHRTHPDLHIIEPEGASIKKEQIVQLQQEFSKKGVETSHKIYILHDADKMTVNAANSLLKFLEEPNAKTTAILITENVQRILPTIYSRCQHLSFRPISKPTFIQMLVENGIDPVKAPLFSQLTNNLDEAIQLKEDDWFLQARKIVLKLYEILTQNHLADAILYVHSDWLVHFKERQQIDKGLDMLLFIYRDLLYLQLERYEELVYPDYRDEWGQVALLFTREKLLNQILAILETKRKLQSNVNGALLMEQLILKLMEGSSFV